MLDQIKRRLSIIPSKVQDSRNSAVVPYKAVLIVGSNSPIPDNIREQYKQAGFLIIGDGIHELHSLDLDLLRDKIDKTTKILISAHGIVDKDRTHLLDGKPTSEFLSKLAKASSSKDPPTIPLNVALNACYAGSAAPAVKSLPVNSVLVTHGPPDDPTLNLLGNKTIFKSSQGFDPDPVQDFLHRFSMHVTQTATISIHKPDGSIFQHVIRHPGSIITSKADIIRHLEAKREEFIIAYNRKCTPKIKSDPSNAITPSEAEEWCKDHFLYMAQLGKDKFVKALNETPDIFQVLIKHNVNGINALHLAAYHGKGEEISALLKFDKIDINSKYQGCTALIIATMKGRVGAVSSLLKSTKIDINLEDNEGNTALILAVKGGYAEIAYAILTSNKPNINLNDSVGNTALMLAAHVGNGQVVSALLASDKFDINLNDGKYTALTLAAKEGHAEVVSVLLKSAKININEGDQGTRALMYAVKNGNTEVVSVLLKSGKIDITAKYNESIKLVLAAYRGDNNAVSALLASGNFGIKEERQITTAFILAASKGHEQVVSTMLASGKINVNSLNNNGETALMCAVGGGHDKVISILLTSGNIDINTQNKDGNTALLLAAVTDHPNAASTLLASDKIDLKVGNQGTKALMTAAVLGHDKVISAMLNSGKIDINARDELGYTALMWAAMGGHDQLVATLLEKSDKSSIRAQGTNGKTALMIAREAGHEEIANAIAAADTTLKPGVKALGEHTRNLADQRSTVTIHTI